MRFQKIVNHLVIDIQTLKKIDIQRQAALHLYKSKSKITFI